MLVSSTSNIVLLKLNSFEAIQGWIATYRVEQAHQLVGQFKSQPNMVSKISLHQLRTTQIISQFN